MKRAIALILVLSLLCFGTSIWVDLTQQNTARAYLYGLSIVRELIGQNQLENAAHEQAYLHAKWQHDSVWLNCIASHHHTRGVSTAMVQLATALEHGWVDEALRALDSVEDTLGDIENANLAKLENLL